MNEREMKRKRNGGINEENEENEREDNVGKYMEICEKRLKNQKGKRKDYII